MDTSVLEEIGLSKDQAKTYSLLLQNGSLSPQQLMKLSGETRTNAYMSLAKLEQIGLAHRDKNAKKLTYLALSPTKLESFIDHKRRALDTQNDKLKSALPKLLQTYYTSAAKPVVSFYEGDDTLYKVYEDHLSTKQDVYFVRTPADEKFFGDKLYSYMQARADAGIHAYGLAPHTPEREAYAKANDKKLRRTMTWCKPSDYKSPVEISIYGNKVAFISFEKETHATILDSPTIAKAMKELFQLAQAGASKG